MKVYTATKARAEIFNIVKEANITHEPCIITSKNGNAVLLSQDDYDSVQETLFIMSNPKLKESILEASKAKIDECLEWNDDV